MDLVRCQYLAHELIKEHLGGWGFRLNRGRVVTGLCCFPQKTIYLSRFYVELNDESLVRNTVLHEIAHGQTGDRSHGPLWESAFRKLGGVGGYVNDKAIMPAGRWISSCWCGRIHRRHRLPRPGWVDRCFCGFSPLLWTLDKEMNTA